MQSLVKEKANTCPWVWLRNTRQARSRAVLPRAPPVAGDHAEASAASGRWWDTHRCARACGRPVLSVRQPHPHPHPHLSFRPDSAVAPGGACTPRVSSLLLGDDSFTDNWKLEFWKRSIYLKENRSYLWPPVKYYGNMSANNLLCVICSNANRQQLGHFLW